MLGNIEIVKNKTGRPIVLFAGSLAKTSSSPLGSGLNDPIPIFRLERIDMLGKLFSLFATQSVTVEQWAEHNSKKATADDLIAGAIVASFAKDYKHWKFEGDFHQKWSSSSKFMTTILSRKMPTKKHVVIVFVFKQTDVGGDYPNLFKYKVIGCEVNGIRVTDAAFKYIYKNWNNLVVQMKAAETAAAKAKSNMELNETKWDLAESLLGMKRDGLGRLVPIKTAEA